MSRSYLARHLLGRWRWTITRAVGSSLLNDSWRDYLLPHWSTEDSRVFSNIKAISSWSPPAIDQLQLQMVSSAGFYTRSTQEKLIRGRRVYLLSNVSVDVTTAIPWNRSGWILGDAAWDLEDMRHSEAPRGWKSVALEAMNDLTVVAPVRDNYFHYLIEDLPGTLRVLELYPDARVLVPRETPDWILASLREIGLQPTLGRGSPVRLESYAAVTRQAGHPTPEEIQVLRMAFGADSVDRQSDGLRIFISRRGHGRRATWEDTLTEDLKSKGFLCVEPSQLSVSKQVQLFGRAIHIVGFGGAGLTNMVWMPSGGRVTIIDNETRFANSVYNWVWPRLAEACGHRHEVMLLDEISGANIASRVIETLQRVIHEQS